MNATDRRLLIIAICLSAFAVGMTFLLIVFKLEQTHRELRHDRFALVADDIDRLVEQNLALGMDFRALPSLQPALLRRIEVDSAIQSISVADPAGHILYSTDPSVIAASLPAQWLSAIAQQHFNGARKLSGADHDKAGIQPDADLRWRIADVDRDLDYAVAGNTVVNSFGVAKGYVAVRYSVREGRAAANELVRTLGVAAWSIFSMTAFILFLIMRSMSRRFDAEVTQAAAAITNPSLAASTMAHWGTLLTPAISRMESAQAELLSWQKSVATGTTSAATSNPKATVSKSTTATPGDTSTSAT